MVETKERVKILLATLHNIARGYCQFYNMPLKVKVAFDVYKKYVLSCKALLLTDTPGRYDTQYPVMIQAGAKTQAFKGLEQKKICKVYRATTQGDYGLHIVKS